MSYQLLTVAVAGAAFALVGIIYNSDAAYFMCAALLAVLLVSFALSRLSARGLTWRRELIDRVYEHDAFGVTLHVTNRGRLPLFFLRVSDCLPEHVWTTEAPQFLLAALWPGEQARLTYQARAAKRGVFLFEAAEIWVSDPFGLFPRVRLAPAAGEAVVLPRPLPLRAEFDRGGRDLRGLVSGDLSRATESGLEFYGIRDYQPGDELRRIHWPATAHHGKITVIEYERGVSGSLLVALDTHAGSEIGAGLNTSLETGVKAAASLLHWVLGNDGTGCLSFGAGESVHWEQAESAIQEPAALEALAWARADAHLPLSAVGEWAAGRAPAGAVVVFVTAAPDPALATVARWLTGAGTQVLVLALDPEAFGGRGGLPRQAEQELRAAGARVARYRRGDDLQEYLVQALEEHDR